MPCPEKRLTAVRAGAGTGKTTLLADCQVADTRRLAVHIRTVGLSADEAMSLLACRQA